MIQVKLKTDSKFGKKGDVVYVTRNIAHGLIDQKLGDIYRSNIISYKDKMLRSKK